MDLQEIFKRSMEKSYKSAPRPFTPWLARGIKFASVVLVIGSFIAGGLRLVGGSHSAEEPVGGLDSIPPRLYEESLRGLGVPAGSLVNKVRGRSFVAPLETLHVSAPVPAPDTAYGAVRVDGDGRLTLAQVTRNGTGYSATLYEKADISKCDDGWSVTPAGIACDRSRLGHLYVTSLVGASTGLGLAGPRASFQIGVEWEPSYRSSLSLYIGAGADGRISAGARKRFEVW